ncbi:dephospho-CoA kinase [Oceanobacillus limi]|uniref:Dephospho-CoA kinase n=1 Tax=Oceanobacillus limi TaxID=930131 RepID=A0A1I0EGQ4_9BACI|nr:dephospho-CoA kinase [Oceanobacillus limi]SET44415.1 dephospho-CoA kinase [Oceanobacillus limi]
MALIIGLTGSIASGKSTVSHMFHDLNIPVVDADKISREVVNRGEKAYQEIIDVFGEGILTKSKIIDRKKLGAIIFKDETKRNQLNGIVHPAVRERMLEKRDTYVEAGEKCIVLDIPLLFESKLTHFVDKTLVVFVDEDVQLQRLMERDGYTEEEADQRIQSQIPVKEKAKLADAVINNNGTINETNQQLKQILHDWQVL